MKNTDALSETAEAGQRASEGLARMSGQLGTMSDRIRRAVRARKAQVIGTPEWRWEQQWPVFPCPWVPEPCPQIWDRREISDEDLRMELWDHAHEHAPGETGHRIGGWWAASVMDKETWS